MQTRALVFVAVGVIAGLAVAAVPGSTIPTILIVGAALPLYVVLCGGVRPAFGYALAVLLFGFAAFGRGFSYLGSPPFYVGEIVLALAVGVLIFVKPTHERRSHTQAGLWVLLAFGGILLALDLGSYGVDALRDSVIFAYAIMALAVVRAWTPTTARIVQHTYERLAPYGVVLLSVRLATQIALPGVLSKPTVNGVPLLGVKPGDAAIHLSLFLVYLTLFRGRGIARWTRSPAIRATLAVTATFGLLVAIVGNRGGMLAAATALSIAFLFSRRQVAILAGAVAALVLMLAVGPLVVDAADAPRRDFSVQQITENILSVVTNDDNSLDGTRTWRLRWWGDIVEASTSANRLLRGDGFGPNLTVRYGISSDPNVPLRSPHNAVMTVLARGGIAFTFLWLLVVALCARAALATRRHAIRRRLPDAPALVALAALTLAAIGAMFVDGLFDVYLEGPVGGMWFWATCGAAVGLAGVTRPPRLDRDAPIVTTVAGALAGTLRRASDGTTVRQFLGIPYAQAPVGDLRWRAPLPPNPWTGTRSGTAFAPAAPQGAALESRLPGFAPDHPTSEDCLALNVWTPGLHGARPVVVWFPGGAYLSGATAQPVYDGALLAAEANAVVVTVGYRLGALGFLDPEGDGVANCGLRDQLAALDWIRRHAAAFGGNPGNVTVAGESAGAGSILHLLASPLIAESPPFHRAIVQSGQPTTLTADQGRGVAEAFAQHLGLDRLDADALRQVPVDRLLDAQAATSADVLESVGPMAFAPVIDDDVCDGTIVDGLATGRATEIDLVIGTTRDELALFADPGDDELDDDQLLGRIGRLVGKRRDAAPLLADCRARLPEAASNADVWNAARTAVMMRAPALRVADAHTRAGGTTYVYRFDWAAPGLGAAHGVDLPFTFGTADREGWDSVVGWDTSAEALGREWRACWSFFAATGDPSTPVRSWPAHDPEHPAVMVFAPDAVRVVPGLDSPQTAPAKDSPSKDRPAKDRPATPR